MAYKNTIKEVNEKYIEELSPRGERKIRIEREIRVYFPKDKEVVHNPTITREVEYL